MGAVLARVNSFFNSSKPRKLMMIGLDAAGKTTILVRLKLKETATTIPTIGFNVETINYKNLNMTIWDLGGQDHIRKLWYHYYEGNNGVIFVVDSSDQERMTEVAEELHYILRQEELKGVPLLIYANKQDMPGAVSAGSLAQTLSLDKVTDR